MDKTINIPFQAKLEMDSNNFSYIDHDLVRVQTYANTPKAIKVLKKQVIEQVEEGLRAAKNSQARAIGCVNGDVFIVRYSLGSWHYSIVGPGRKHGGSVCIGENSFDGAYSAASKHAEQMSGIAWECSV